MNIRYQFYNPHPQQKLVGDCVKRALVKATGNSYRDVQIELNRIKRELGEKCYTRDRVWREYLKRHNFLKVSYPAVAGKKRMNVERMAEENNYNDVYVCQCAHHLVCVTNNKYWDTWDSGEKCVYIAYKKIN